MGTAVMAWPTLQKRLWGWCWGHARLRLLRFYVLGLGACVCAGRSERREVQCVWCAWAHLYLAASEVVSEDWYSSLVGASGAYPSVDHPSVDVELSNVRLRALPMGPASLTCWVCGALQLRS